MELPSYPDVIRTARLTGSAVVQIELDRDAKPIHVDVNGSVHKLLSQYIQSVISRAEYRHNCANLRIALTLRFELTGEDSDSPQVRVELVWPNTIVIRARPPRLNRNQ
jgi:hypothetical protein